MYAASDMFTVYLNKLTSNKINEITSNPKKLRAMVLFIVCVALFLDNMLYMVIVPIIPFYIQNIYNISHETTTTMQPMGRMLPIVEMASLNMTNSTMKDIKTFANLNNLNMSMFNNSSVKTKIRPLIPYSEKQDSSIGLLFASKAFVQLILNPVSGTVIDRVGYDYPLLFGLVIIFFSTLLFAGGTSYGVLFIARSLQGVGSAFADTAGLAMIADRYPEANERKKALGIVIAFISFGSLFAPPFGGILFEIAGKALPFIILAIIALFDGILLIIIMRPVREERNLMKKSHDLPKGTSIHKLIMDPYIAICAGALVIANVSLAFLEPTIAIWMRETMGASEWAIGLVWLPAFFPHVFGVYLTVKLAQKNQSLQWIIIGIGLLLDGLGCILIPLCTSYVGIIIPLMIICFGIALVDTALLPTLGYLVDSRHVSVYGSVYAIADISYSIAYALGPIVASNIVNSFGFVALCVFVFLACILYTPLIGYLRNIYRYENFVNVDENYDNESCESPQNEDENEQVDRFQDDNDQTLKRKRSIYKYNRFNSSARDTQSKTNEKSNEEDVTNYNTINPSDGMMIIEERNDDYQNMY